MTRSRWVWFGLVMLVVIRTAWLTDDALITLRTVLNVTHGYGLTYNIAERVQTFTHPLWLVVLTASYLLVGNIFYAAFVASIGAAAVLVWFLLRGARTEWHVWVMAGVMVLSSAFVDYATSGLENALTALIAAATLALAAQNQRRFRWLAGIWCGVALAYLSRPDAVLLVLPAAVWATTRVPWRRVPAAVALGLTPAIVWTMCSLLYYGFPFPNTAYAKLASGIPLGERIVQGLVYMLDSLSRDPLALVTIGVTAGLAWRARDRPGVLAMIGVVAYLGYVVSIGGDFMTGRFVAAPLAVALWALSRIDVHAGLEQRTVSAALALAALAAPAWPLRSDAGYERTDTSNVNAIVDERGVYFRHWGLLRAPRQAFAEPDWPRATADRTPNYVLDTCGLMGTGGLEWGPRTHMLDECALADPLLARLPAVWNEYWRPGHLRRQMPVGYRESIEKGTNLIRDPSLASYYDALTLVVRSPDLWSRERLRTIGGFLRGRLDRLIDWRAYRHGGEVVWLNALSDPKPDGTPADRSDVRAFDRQLAVPVDNRTGRRWIDVSFDSNDVYRVVFLKSGRFMAAQQVDPVPQHRRVDGLMTRMVTIPQRAQDRGFDTIVIVSPASNGIHAVGHLLLDGEASTQSLIDQRRR